MPIQRHDLVLEIRVRLLQSTLGLRFSQCGADLFLSYLIVHVIRGHGDPR